MAWKTPCRVKKDEEGSCSGWRTLSNAYFYCKDKKHSLLFFCCITTITKKRLQWFSSSPVLSYSQGELVGTGFRQTIHSGFSLSVYVRTIQAVPAIFWNTDMMLSMRGNKRKLENKTERIFCYSTAMNKNCCQLIHYAFMVFLFLFYKLLLLHWKIISQ